jgi:ABC-type Fe2+-enterobactin transport system substrate-binding protein
MTENVKTWRDDVSKELGYITGKLEQIHSDIKTTNERVRINRDEIQVHHERIKYLENGQIAKVAVKRWLSGVWGAIGVIIGSILHFLWEIFK